MAGDPTITIVGNLTSDPDLRYVGSGAAVASFTVAYNPRKFNRQTNQWEDGETMFFNCSVWREYAENVNQSLSKGMRVIVTGRLFIRTYKRNDGSTGTSVDIQVEDIGPCLRFATATVSKAANGSGFGGDSAYGDSSFGNNSFGAAGGLQGQVQQSAPAEGASYDPWNETPPAASNSTMPF
ncbi:single-stranded DNA-binding protein [uncultured Arcanobacterium sp.]|uniref:single-stranded DNA-binding protein n=1 Tax=uncultured Arcanobacterium sp. TaxID=487520 RepID=UPI00261ED99D|nr:single-stranded DNA-binding protein [uncultured Arcanobacterium sp.]